MASLPIRYMEPLRRGRLEASQAAIKKKAGLHWEDDGAHNLLVVIAKVKHALETLHICRASDSRTISGSTGLL